MNETWRFSFGQKSHSLGFEFEGLFWPVNPNSHRNTLHETIAIIGYSNSAIFSNSVKRDKSSRSPQDLSLSATVTCSSIQVAAHHLYLCRTWFLGLAGPKEWDENPCCSLPSLKPSSTPQNRARQSPHPHFSANSKASVTSSL